MSASADLQTSIHHLLSGGADGRSLRVAVPIIQHRPKDIASRIAEASAGGFFIYILPPLPLSALFGTPFVFWSKVEVRIRITEIPQLNQTGADCYDLIDDVATLLHWRMLPMLAHPLYLAERPIEAAEGLDPADRERKRIARMFDVIFHTQFGFQPPA